MSSRKSKSVSRTASRSRRARSGAGSAGRGSGRSHSPEAKRGGGGSAARAKGGRRSGASAPHAVKLLKQDHRAVERALREFESAAGEEKHTIGQRICQLLTVHAQIEEELLYPAAREALSSRDEHLVAEARVEHSSVKDLIGQIESHDEADEEYEARVQVLGEYVKHHVGEEEKQLFPRLERSSLDLEELGARLEQRKGELMGAEADSSDESRTREEDEEGAVPSGRSREGRGQRSGVWRARKGS
jgi:hemerythrin superfamily protein